MEERCAGAGTCRVVETTGTTCALSMLIDWYREGQRELLCDFLDLKNMTAS